MLREKNQVIAQKGFCTLILDYEFPAENGFSAYCSGRVLIDGYFWGHVSAETKDQLIINFFAENHSF